MKVNIGAIIFSRTTSSRLPGKALLPIKKNKTLIEIIIERVKKIKGIDHICLATSDEDSDDILALKVKELGISVFRGSLNDVMDRSIGASTYYGYTDFLRICGDRPFFDPSIYEELILTHKANKNDLTTNIFPRTVPRGLSGEIINVQALKEIAQKTTNKKDKEHLTNYFYAKNHNYRLQNVNQSNIGLPIEYDLTLDDNKDLQKIIWIQENINPQDRFNLKEIMSLNIKWINNKHK